MLASQPSMLRKSASRTLAATLTLAALVLGFGTPVFAAPHQEKPSVTNVPTVALWQAVLEGWNGWMGKIAGVFRDQGIEVDPFGRPLPPLRDEGGEMDPFGRS